MKLPPSKAIHFFETLMPLLNWVKRTEEGAAALKDARKKDSKNYREDAVLLGVLWEHPAYIDEYLEEMGERLMPSSRRDLAKWREHFVYDSFIVERHTSSGSIFISISNGQVYRVSGISEEIEDVMRRLALPCVVKTALLPYAGRIVYDSVITALPDVLNATAEEQLANVYDIAKRNNRIAKKLPVINQVESGEEWNILVGVMMSTIADNNESMSPEEVAQKLHNDPRLNLIPEEDLATLERLNNQLHRSAEDWNVIMDILLDRCVFTIIPMIATEEAKVVGNVLCHDGYLYVFTTYEKCQEYMDLVIKEDPRQNYVNIITLDLQDAMETAGKQGMNLRIDHPSDKSSVQKFLEYNGKTRHLHSIMMVPPEFQDEVIKNLK